MILDATKAVDFISDNDMSGVEWLRSGVGTEGYYKKIDDTLYIHFVGTNDLKDAILDLLFMKRRYPYDNKESRIRIHSGFFIAYNNVDIRNKIHLIVNRTESKKVFISGHSLGGAIAILCAVDLQYNFEELDIQVITFGSPRVGNKYFVESYNRRVPNTTRVCFKYDLVTMLPFKLCGYKHSGKKFIVDKRFEHEMSKYSDIINELFEEYSTSI